jgi:hypothetical protein
LAVLGALAVLAVVVLIGVVIVIVRVSGWRWVGISDVDDGLSWMMVADAGC